MTICDHVMIMSLFDSCMFIKLILYLCMSQCIVYVMVSKYDCMMMTMTI